MSRPEKQPAPVEPPKNEDLFRVYVAFVAIAVLLSLSLPLLT